jgi:hypothetical protein
MVTWKNVRGGDGFLVSCPRLALPSSELPFPLDSHPFFLRRGHDPTRRAKRVVRSASSFGSNYGGIFPAMPKSSSPCCLESRACPPPPARSSNFAQIISEHKQYTLRRGRIILSAHVKANLCTRQRVFS